ncbi:glycosyltransferase [Sphingomonas sanguinis]|uniref:Glycosyltransferase n=1 Tax=Sphingomonas sanguinis TaxID=33051 RepID=A0ABU5LSX8_9SPHN|nr:glycosyltransferase family 2 protein [Sphingomonas sanguinis]MDZ7283012.1 glycosyltransferase [Sphingomonas sanguinis]
MRKLAICIPTYNRAIELRTLLASIIHDIGESPDVGARLEIVVSDNASTDETPAVILEFQGQFDRLTYTRHDHNLGPDRNFLAAVAHAQAEYCWLMGSDDMIEQGGIARLLKILDAHPDACGVSVARQARTSDLKDKLPENLLAAYTAMTSLHGAEKVFESIAHYFGYLSGQIVHKQTWDRVVATYPVADFYNAYVHVYVIAQMLRQRPEWLVVPDRLVGCRSDNDFFMYDGRFNRVRIDVVGYEQIAAAVFGIGSKTYRSMRDTIATRHVRYNIIGARLKGEWNPILQRKIAGLALRYYWRSPAFWLKTMPYILVPQIAYRHRGWVMSLVRRRNRYRTS